jgi:hypothetical protein
MSEEEDNTHALEAELMVRMDRVKKIKSRPEYKQRTFPGKPLSDAETVQANQIAGELEDGPALGRMYKYTFYCGNGSTVSVKARTPEEALAKLYPGPGSVLGYYEDKV